MQTVPSKDHLTQRENACLCCVSVPPNCPSSESFLQAEVQVLLPDWLMGTGVDETALRGVCQLHRYTRYVVPPVL